MKTAGSDKKERVPGNKRGGPVKPGRQTLGEVERGFADQWTRFRKALRRARARLSSGNVHAFRVSARCLMAWHELLAGAIAPETRTRNCAAIKKQIDLLGDLRDAQVQQAMLKPLRREFEEAAEFGRWLKRREEKLCGKARRRLRRRDPGEWNRLKKRALKEMGKSFAGSDREECVSGLFANLKGAFEAAKRLRDRATPEDTRTIHKARIAFKRFRYILNALDGPVMHLPPVFLDRLRDYQGAMGRIQDLEMLLARHDKYAHRHDRHAVPAEALRAALARERDRAMGTYFRTAGRLDGFWPSAAGGKKTSIP